MTDFERHMAAGYQHAMHGGDDPVHRAAVDLDPAAVAAEMARLEEVQDRCHVSRVRLGFLRRVREAWEK